MDTTRQEIVEDIKDKARSFCNTQEIILIRTRPSVKYPKGAKFEGRVVNVNERNIHIWDTYVNESIFIYLSDIESPADLWLKPEEKEE